MFTCLLVSFILTEVCHVSDFVIAAKRANGERIFYKDRGSKLIEIKTGPSTIPIYRDRCSPKLEERRCFSANEIPA